MPKTRTNSIVVEHHDDGSWTEKTDVTYLPPTPADKALVAAVVGGSILFVASPVILATLDLIKERRAERKARKAAKTEQVD